MEGIDYSSGRPGGAAIAAAGKQFVIRYLRYRGLPDPAKALSAVEVVDLHAHGISVVANFESTATRVLDGQVAGAADGTDARVALNILGAPADMPVYFSVDFDIHLASQFAKLDAYLAGVATQLPIGRIGVYGSLRLVRHCQAAKNASWFWQASAWSGGLIAGGIHVYQYQNGQRINGASVDFDRSLQANYGQWAPVGAGPSEPTPVRTFYFGTTTGSVTPKTDPAIRMLRLVDDALLPIPADFGTRFGMDATIAPGIGVPAGTTGYFVTYRSSVVFLLASNVVFSATTADCTAAIAADRGKAKIVYG